MLLWQGRYLPNSKWAPCDPDDHALAEDAQRLQVNNVAGDCCRDMSTTKNLNFTSNACMEHVLAYKSLQQYDVAKSTRQGECYLSVISVIKQVHDD